MSGHTLQQNQKTRPVGRPRANGRPHLTELDVFAGAAKLIAQHGYSGTSIRMLATTLGATPASIFHLFKSKEDILNRLICFASGPSIAFYEGLQALSVNAGVLLYKSLLEEVALVAAVDQAFPALFYLPELAKPDFAPAQAARRTMVKHYEDIIKRGIKDDLFETVDPALTSEQFFQLTETSILAGPNARHLTPAEQAEATARLCLRAILKKPSTVETIARAAHKIRNQIDTSAFSNQS
ncbi:MAG: TetR/AcrR family transcriptional regulator [Parvibaculum sp.]